MTDDEPRIALDLEGVLADTHLGVLKHSDSLEPEDFDEWDFEDAAFKMFMDELKHVWTHHPEDIPPSESRVGYYVDLIRSQYQVDLVTNTPAEREEVEQWLVKHAIEVDNIHIPGPGTHKEDLGYDIYIDDNPYLVGQVPLLYFVTTRWNEHLDADNINTEYDPADVIYYDLTENEPMVLNSLRDNRNIVVRVDSLEQVYEDLSHRRVGTSTAL